MAIPDLIELPYMPCPECRMKAKRSVYPKKPERRYRIGGNPNCPTCKHFRQTVGEATHERMNALFPLEYRMSYVQAMRDLYPQVMEEFEALYPGGLKR